MRSTTKAFVALAIAVFAASSVGCGPSDEEVAAKRRVQELEGQLREAGQQREAMEHRLSELSNVNRNMADRLRSLGQNVEELESQRGQLQTSLDETTRALEELRARQRQAEARLADFRRLQESLRALISAGTIQVRLFRGRLVLGLNESVLFDSGQADLKPEGRTALTQIAGVLEGLSNRQFQICGHTDNLPIRSRRFPSNWELSTARAVNVARFLVDNGLDGTRVSAAGYADTQPLENNTNATDEERAQNRRIDIAMQFNVEELPDIRNMLSGG